VLLGILFGAIAPFAGYWLSRGWFKPEQQQASTESVAQGGYVLPGSADSHLTNPDPKPDPEAQSLPIRDMAKMFSQGAIIKAKNDIGEFKKRYNRDLVIETFLTLPDGNSEKVKAMSDMDRKDFFGRLVQDRMREERVNGVYVFYCLNPGLLTSQQSDERDAVLDNAAWDKFLDGMMALVKEQKNDEALEFAVTFVGTALAKGNAATTPPRPTPEVVSGKLPIPSEKEQASSLEALKDVFADNYKKSDIASVQALAQKFLQEGRETEKVSMRFVMFCESRDLFSRAGDQAGAMSAIDELAKRFAVDEREQRAKALDTVGKLYCFEKGDWDKGLTYLSRGPEGKLKALALRELAKPAEIAGQLELADGWWDIAEGEQSPAKRQVQLRAYKWYQMALPMTAPGPERARVEKRLEALAVGIPELNTPLELRSFVGHTDTVLCAVFSPDGRRILTGGKDSGARLWDSDSGKELKLIQPKTGPITTLGFSKDGAVVLTGTIAVSDREPKCKVQVAFWDLETGTQSGGVASDRDNSPNNRPFLSFAPGSLQVVIGETKSVPGGLTLCKLDFVDLGNPVGSRPPVVELKATASCMAVNVEGTMILTGGTPKDQMLRLWDLEKGKVISIGGPTTGVQSVAISANGKSGLSGGIDKKIYVWDLPNAKLQTTLTGHSGTVTSLAFSPDGTRVLSGSEDKTVRLWDVKSGKEVCRFSGHKDVVHCVAFSPDGRRGLSAGDNTVRLYQLPR
jgi:WD40 repeat protein